MKSYEYKLTKHPDIERLVDRDGNWQHYFIKSKNLYLRGVTTILEKGYPKDSFLINWIASKGIEERDRILKAAGDRGDKVHRWVDNVLSNEESSINTISRDMGVFSREKKDYEELSNDEWDCVLSFVAFWEGHAAQLIASESTLYNERDGYAGTSDALLVLTKACGGKYCKCAPFIGKIGLWDWKTSSGMRDTFGPQIAAYSMADNLPEYLPAGRTMVDYGAIARFGTAHKNGGYELKFFDGREMLDNYGLFLHAKAIASVSYKPFDPETDIEEIPDEVTITVTKYVPPVEEKKETPRSSGKVKKQTNGKSKGNRKGIKRAA